MSQARHHRPAQPGSLFFEAQDSGSDPVRLAEAAERAAVSIVRGARASVDPTLAERVVALAESEGLDALAALWSEAPADSVGGCLWRLYLLRSWVYADPLGAARQFEAGRTRLPVARVLAGVAEPPGPEEIKLMCDDVLRGIAERDFADVLFRASAFARVVSAGRAADPDASAPEAVRMLRLAEQLEAAGHTELAGQLG
ncbi:MAG: hypothetical protein WAW88_17805 [Nocardioides sp.]